MPDPSLVATIIAGGSVYDYWQSLEIERVALEAVSYMRFSCAEMTSKRGWNNLRLSVGDSAQGFLAGRQVISGVVETRQVAYDPLSHGVEIIVASLTQNVIASTVDANPGQYSNSTFTQIANAVCGPVGVTCNIIGSPPGADKPFERVSELVGETRFQFLERLARMRNIHVVDDGNGALNFFRGSQGDLGASLVEGQNIKSLRLIMRNQFAADPINAIGQNFGTDQHWGEQASNIIATVTNPNYSGNRPLTILAEEAADKADLQMRVNHEMNANALTQCDCWVTVPGWLMDDGSLWIEHVGKMVTVVSPMAFPTDTFSLAIKGVKHMQNSETGTTTELQLCLEAGLGDQISGSPGGSSTNIPGSP